MLKNLLIQNRTRRRFYQNELISPEILRELVDLTRYTPSTANSQALKFRIVYTPEECSALFPHLIWAGALKDWDGPEEGERKPKEIVKIVDVPESGCIDYYRDREGIHYVPKRELKDILLPGNPKKM